jgi:putative DNA primase/helicase
MQNSNIPDSVGKPENTPPVVKIYDPHDHSDEANDLEAGKRLLKRHKSSIKYCPSIGWLVWNGSRWIKDKHGLITMMADNLATQFAEAAEEAGLTNVEINAARSQKNGIRIEAAIKKAKTYVLTDIEEFDTDPWQLVVKNGTIDLHTQELRLSKRSDNNTKTCDVEYIKNASHPSVDKIFETIEKATPGLTPFLLRCIGASLIGTPKEKIFFFNGPGGSGKTTLMGAVTNMLGDYAQDIPIETLAEETINSGCTPYLVSLKGARFVTATEGKRHLKLNSGLVKKLTGGEASISVNPKFLEAYKIKQTWGLWISSNFDMNIDHDDGGMWRRMYKIIFNQIPEKNQDKKIKNDLYADQLAKSALLCKCLEGLKDYLENEYNPPEIMITWQKNYQDSMDPLKEWWEQEKENIQINEHKINKYKFITISDVVDSYERYCDINKIKFRCSTPRIIDIICKQYGYQKAPKIKFENTICRPLIIPK